MKHEREIPRQARRDRMLHEHGHDPYKTGLKLPEPTVRPPVRAVFLEGRWHWAPRPDGAREELCQACHRINNHHAAGEVTIAGDFVSRHKDEILHPARPQGDLEKAQHPLHRIMYIEAQNDAMVVRTRHPPAAADRRGAAPCLPRRAASPPRGGG